MACRSSSQRASSTLQGHSWSAAAPRAPCPPPPPRALPPQVLLHQRGVQQSQLLVQVLDERGHGLRAAPSAPDAPGPTPPPAAGRALTSSFWMESGDRLMCWTYFLMSATICGRAALAPGGRTLGSQLPRGRPPTLEVRCAVTVWTSCRRSSSRACVQLSRGRGSSPSSAEVASGHARPRSACPAALRRSSTLLRTTQSWGGESDVGARAAHAGPPGPRPHQPAHWLAHCLACSPGLSVHLLPQQLSVEEGGLAQVLGWDERAQQLWAAGPGPAPLPDSCLLPDRAPQPTSTHLAELGAQRLGLSRVWPRQAGPQLLDVTEAEASSGCGAAVLGGGIHGLQLRRREEAWIAGRPWLSPAASGLGAYSLCPRPRLPEVST